MKIKCKIKPSEYNELVKIVSQFNYQRIAITHLELINLKHFYFEGVQKMQVYQFKSLMGQYNKPKLFSIDVNHYEAIKNALIECGNSVTPLTQSIFETIKQAAEPQILRAVSGYKLIG